MIEPSKRAPKQRVVRLGRSADARTERESPPEAIHLHADNRSGAVVCQMRQHRPDQREREELVRASRDNAGPIRQVV